MMQVPQDSHISQKLGLIHHLHHVLIRIKSLRHLSPVNLVKLIFWWLYDRLRQRLVVLLFNQRLDTFSVDFLCFWIVLLVFVKHHLLASLVVFFIHFLVIFIRQ